jgi:hypothetical protein
MRRWTAARRQRSSSSGAYLPQERHRDGVGDVVELHLPAPFQLVRGRRRREHAGQGLAEERHATPQHRALEADTRECIHTTVPHIPSCSRHHTRPRRPPYPIPHAARQRAAQEQERCKQQQQLQLQRQTHLESRGMRLTSRAFTAASTRSSSPSSISVKCVSRTRSRNGYTQRPRPHT